MTKVPSIGKGSWLVLALAAAAVIVQVFVPPTVGSADNGDFTKVSGMFGLPSPNNAEDNFKFADIHWKFNPKLKFSTGFYTSEKLFGIAAIEMNRRASAKGDFDLRFMGVIHSLFYLGAFYLLLPVVAELPQTRRYLLLGLVLFMFTDVMYVSYMNSFFMDTASLLGALLLVVAFLRVAMWQRTVDRFLFLFAAGLLLTSKAQHAPLGIPIAALLIGMTPNRTFSNKIWGLASAALVLALAVYGFRGAPSAYSAFARYNVVFFQILPRTENIEKSMADLGLDDSYRKFSGTQAYFPDSGVSDPEFTERFSRAVSFSGLGYYFLTHPRDVLQALEDRLAEAGRQRPHRGNFDVLAGRPPFAESQSFAVWSGWKARLFWEHGLRYLSYALTLCAVAILLAFRVRKKLPAVMQLGLWTLVAMLLLELAVTALGDGPSDSERQFLVFHALTDVLLISIIALGMYSIGQTRSPASADAEG